MMNDPAPVSSTIDQERLLVALAYASRMRAAPSMKAITAI
jgi:hypothetical protein